MIRRRSARVLVMLIAVALLPPVAVAGSQGQPTATPVAVPGTVVGGEGVNIRECPRADCVVRAVAKLGERLTVRGETVDGYVPVARGGVEGFAYALYVATAAGGTPELRRGPAGCNRVALIFNVGVGYENRLGILDALKADGVPATVFPMGWWAAKHPDLLKRIDAAGFPIGSHGDQRVNLTERDDAGVIKDIRDAEAAIERAIGRPPEPYFTPYAAAIDERVRSLIARAGYLPVVYTLAADDWDHGADPNVLWENVVPHVTDGAIVEFHLDAPASAESTAVALPWIVERLRAKGYRFVTVPEIGRPCT